MGGNHAQGRRMLGSVVDPLQPASATIRATAMQRLLSLAAPLRTAAFWSSAVFGALEIVNVAVAAVAVTERRGESHAFGHTATAVGPVTERSVLTADHTDGLAIFTRAWHWGHSREGLSFRSSPGRSNSLDRLGLRSVQSSFVFC